MQYTGKEHLEIKLDTSKPTGPMNRVADNSVAKKLLGWEPKVKCQGRSKYTSEANSSQKLTITHL